MGCMNSKEPKFDGAVTKDPQAGGKSDGGDLQNSANGNTIPAKVEDRTMIIALYDYEARTSEDLPFHKNDRMILISDADHDWWFVEHCTSKIQGYIPSNYVSVDDSFSKFDWFMKISRQDAARMIAEDSNPLGTYLVRESETNPGTYALTVKCRVDNSGPKVKHYRVRQMDNGDYFVSARKQCSSLESLISYYQYNEDGLCCLLTKVCPKPKPQTAGLSREMKDKWEVDRADLIKQERLGHGNFGEVWRGVWNKTTPVAIKTLKPGSMSPEAFLEEAKVMKECRHDHLVQLFAVCTKEEPIFIVTELMGNGSLKDYLRSDAGRKVEIAQLIDMGSQVASGMDYLARKPLIHRDLAARNVLVGQSNLCKVADFGMARLLEDDEYKAQQGAKFPVKWTAPEACNFQRFSVKSDVWSFGILLVEIITHGAIPYPGMSNAEVLTQLDRGYRHPLPRNCPPALYNLMKECWNNEPDDRPTFEFLAGTLEDFEIATAGQYADT